MESTYMAMLRRLSATADRITGMRRERANKAARAAGLGDQRNVWTNAMISRDRGKPWAEVDYSKLRMALRIECMPSPFALVDRWHRRQAAGGAA